MRKTLVIVFFVMLNLVWHRVFAQNYQPLIPNQEQYFIDQTGFIRGAKVYYADTIGTDTILSNFYAIENDTLSCPPPEGFYETFNVFGSSWLGRKIVWSTNGATAFYNALNNPITLYPRAVAQTVWNAFDLGNGNYLEATIDTIIEITVLGATDSVKVILLQAKDVSNNPIPHIFNGKTISIGKAGGLVSAFNFLNFPSDTAQYTITDKTKMTRRDVYEYNVGDVVQIKIDDADGMQAYDTLEYVTRTILDKTLSTDLDTVTYLIQYHHRVYRTYYDWQNHINVPVDTTIYSETLTVSYTMLSAYLFQRMPEESSLTFSLDEYQLTSKQQVYSGRRVAETFTSYDIYNPENDTCFHYYGGSDGGWDGYTYIEGLGNLYNSGGIVHGYFETIIYYQIGNETYGTLFTSVKEHKRPQIYFFLYPNPATTTLTIESAVGSKLSSVEIYNAQGQLVYNSTFDIDLASGETTFDISSFPSGLYYLHLQSAEGVAVKKFEVIR